MSEVSWASHPTYTNTPGAARRGVLVNGNLPVIVGEKHIHEGRVERGPWDGWGKSCNRLKTLTVFFGNPCPRLTHWSPTSHTLWEGTQTLHAACLHVCLVFSLHVFLLYLPSLFPGCFHFIIWKTGIETVSLIIKLETICLTRLVCSAIWMPKNFLNTIIFH